MNLVIALAVQMQVKVRRCSQCADGIRKPDARIHRIIRRFHNIERCCNLLQPYKHNFHACVFLSLLFTLVYVCIRMRQRARVCGLIN